MHSHPCSARHPGCGCHIDILRRTVTVIVCVVMTYHPSHTIHYTGCLLPWLMHGLKQIHHGFVKLCQITGTCQPVIHLQIDINGIFTVPHRHKFSIPDSLEIQRRAALSAAGYDQIASELEIQCCQGRFLCAASQCVKPLLQAAGSGLPQIQLTAFHERRKIPDMLFLQALVSLFLSRVQVFCYLCAGI